MASCTHALNKLSKAAMSLALMAALAAAVANNPIDDATPALLPDLRGEWTDDGSNVTCRVDVHEPFDEPAKMPFSSYRRCCAAGADKHREAASCSRCAVARERRFPAVGPAVLTCDDGARGRVVSHSEVVLVTGRRWRKTAAPPPPPPPPVHTVHMIYMNHYDVGYTSYINNVDNVYMHQYFHLAASTAQQMRANGTDSFIYTTHPWLMQRYLECPCPAQNTTVQPCALTGVWGSGSTLLYVSSVSPSEAVASCLTTDIKNPAAAGCGWGQASCTVAGAAVTCKTDAGTTLSGTLSGDTVTFSSGGAAWDRYAGAVSGLWYGPSDTNDVYVMAHNASGGALSVWWDVNVSKPLWHYGTGSVTGGTSVSLLIPDYNRNPIVGTLSDNKNLITWVGGAGTWNRHQTTCLPGVASCAEKACPARSLNNPYSAVLECPSASEVAEFTAAVGRGDIVWHGGPFNWQPENLSPELFDAGIDIVRRMDERFYNGAKNTTTMSIRDVIYVTRSVLPLLKKRGVTGLTIGSNPADYPPQVPKLHRWLDEATGADVIVAYHPYGYGGYGVSDCAVSPKGVALCTEFRVDNTGPPKNVGEVEQSLAAVRKEFSGATVKTSTFDAFIADVMPEKDTLPVVTNEVGDTWVYGNPSDPLKMAQYRALQRAWIACMNSGEPACAPTNKVIQNMTWALLKAPEHTWGTPGISGWGGGDSYNTTKFRANLNSTSYLQAAASWAEQRFFNELAVRALEEADHPLAKTARAEVETIANVAEPSPAGFTEVPTTSAVTFAGTNTVMQLGADGSIVKLSDATGEWASPTAPQALLTYKTFNETEWKPFTYSYINGHGESGGFSKPGSNDFSESNHWTPTLSQVWVRGTASSASALLAKMTMPAKTTTQYGSWKTVYLNVTMTRGGGGMLEVDLTVTTLGKEPVMIGESTSLSFVPAPKLLPLGANQSAWTVDKLGEAVDPEGVQDGGNQYCHGTWSGVTARTASGMYALETLDAINVNPITPSFPFGNPLPASYLASDAAAGTGMTQLARGSVKGMAVNLHNNLWNTNYDLFWPVFDPMYCTTPYDCKTANALWRFKLTLG